MRKNKKIEDGDIERECKNENKGLRKIFRINKDEWRKRIIEIGLRKVDDERSEERERKKKEKENKMRGEMKEKSVKERMKGMFGRSINRLKYKRKEERKRDGNDDVESIELNNMRKKGMEGKERRINIEVKNEIKWIRIEIKERKENIGEGIGVENIEMEWMLKNMRNNGGEGWRIEKIEEKRFGIVEKIKEILRKRVIVEVEKKKGYERKNNMIWKLKEDKGGRKS